MPKFRSDLFACLTDIAEKKTGSREVETDSICRLLPVFRRSLGQRTTKFRAIVFLEWLLYWTGLFDWALVEAFRTNLNYWPCRSDHQLSDARWGTVQNAKDRDEIWQACYWLGLERRVNSWACTDRKKFWNTVMLQLLICQITKCISVK